MNDPRRVYGDASKFRRRLSELIRTGKAILDELEGGRHSTEPDSDSFLDSVIWATAVNHAEGRISRWTTSITRLMRVHLPSATDDFKTPLSKAGWGRPSLDVIDDYDKYVRSTLDKLQVIRERLPAYRGVHQAAPPNVRLDELRASGLVAIEVIDSCERRMSRLGRRRDWPAAVSGAKELVEATLMACLEPLGLEPLPRSSNLLRLGKHVREALEARHQRPLAEALSQAHSGMASVLQAIATMRNEAGEGHGKPEPARDLERRHARLAVDCAETYVRYLVTTIDDLGLLPPIQPRSDK